MGEHHDDQHPGNSASPQPPAGGCCPRRHDPARRLRSDEDQTLKIGTVAGPETDVMQVALGIAKEEYDLDAEIVEFTDYVSPNAALADGSLDANAFQHEPYMQSMVEDRGYDFAIAGAPSSIRSAPTQRNSIASKSCRKVPLSPCPTTRPTKAATDPDAQPGLIELEDPQNPGSHADRHHR